MRTPIPHHALQDLAAAHIWGHFAKLTPEDRGGVTVIERGEGCYVWDTNGNRYLDGLAGLFTVQAGHGRHELAKAAAEQAETLAYFPVWTTSPHGLLPTGIFAVTCIVAASTTDTSFELPLAVNSVEPSGLIATPQGRGPTSTDATCLPVCTSMASSVLPRPVTV